MKLNTELLRCPACKAPLGPEAVELIKGRKK